MNNDLIQIDADTAMLLYSKGLTHLPVLKRDGYSSDWTAAQPLYLDDIIEDAPDPFADEWIIEDADDPFEDVWIIEDADDPFE